MTDSAATIAAAISTAPGWARVGITVPNPRVRAAALDELGRHVAEILEHPYQADDRQLGLPL